MQIQIPTNRTSGIRTRATQMLTNTIVEKCSTPLTTAPRRQVIIPTIGILNGTKAEIEEMDIKTRKILTCNGSFHKNSNVDRLYAPRDERGRGIRNILDIYVVRLISVWEHIRERCDEHKYLKEVRIHESEKLFRATEQLRKAHKTSEENLENPRKMSRNITTKIKKNPH